MSALADFHFLRPAWLLAVLVLPLAGLVARRVHGRAGAWRAAIDAHLLPHLIDAPAVRTRSVAPWLAALAWTLACIALAGPAWERENLPLYRSSAARVIAIELAPTMLAADVKPTRLARARHKINDILDASRDMQTALIGYAGDAFVAAPLTDDVNTVRNLVDALEPGVMPVVGNATERAIEEAQRLVKQAGLARGELVLLADAASSGAVAAARAARAQGLTTSVLGIGTVAGAPVPLPQGGFLQDSGGNIVLPKLDEAALRALADAGGGRYATLAADRSDLDGVLAVARDPADARAGDDTSAASERFRDRGPWFVLALLPLAMLAFRRGWLMLLVLACLPIPRAEAFSFADLWQRPDQQAASALAEGEAARAQQLAQDPALRGSAAYRADDYAAAETAFALGEDAAAAYNRGNALAKLGRYDEALAAYDRALGLDAQMEDATANRAAVEEWLKREQQKKDDQKQGDGKSDDASAGDPQDGQSGQPQQGEEGKPSKDGSDAQDGEGKQGAQSGKDPSQKEDQGSGKPQDDPAPESQDTSSAKGEADAASAEAREREQGQQALSKAIDEALGDGKESEREVPVAADADESAREQQQALQQWLQRVPDDPGGLLRRKFQLEHERRQRGGGGR